MKQDKFDEVREAYNDIINKKIIQDKKGIEQKKYLTITIQETKFEEAKQFFAITEPSIFANFLKIGVNLHSLTGEERLYPLYCFYRQGEEDDYDIELEQCMKNGIDWKNEIVPDFIRFDKDMFTSSHLCGRAMYIDPHSYGASFEDKFLDDLISIETCGVFSIDYVPIPRDYLKTTLENKYMAVEDKIATQQQKRNRQKNFMSDITYKVRMEKEEIEHLLEETRTNNAKMLWVGVSAIILAEDNIKLEEYTTSIQKICANNSCVMKSCNYLQREGINTALPIGVRNLPFMRAMFTRMAGGFLPYKVMEAIDYEAPMYYGQTGSGFSRGELSNSHRNTTSNRTVENDSRTTGRRSNGDGTQDRKRIYEGTPQRGLSDQSELPLRSGSDSTGNREQRSTVSQTLVGKDYFYSATWQHKKIS